MPINLDRARDVYEYVEKNGVESAVNFFDVSLDTLHRYIRRYKQLSVDTKEFLKLPKILLFDIETLPMQVRVWGLYKQRIPHTNIVKDWIVLSWAAKWLMDKEILSDVLTPQEAIDRDDKRICSSIWDLINSADIIIAHNGDRFDIRKLNSRFILNGLKQPSPYQSIDTLKQSARYFAHSSHRLDWLGTLIRNEGKIDTDFELWIRCENGEQEALDYMVKYNREDVNLLEEVYVWIRPWIKSHPNVGLYMDLTEPVCANCGSNKLTLEGYYTTQAGRYQAVRCECGAIGRYRSTALTTKESGELIRSIAR